MPAAMNRPGNVNLEIGALRDDKTGRAHPPHLDLIGLMTEKPDDVLAVRVQVVRLRCELPVGSGEEQAFGDEAVECLHISGEHRSAELFLRM